MVTYYIGQLDGNNELCIGVAVLEPLSAPALRTDFTNAGGSTTMIVPVDLLPSIAPKFLPKISGEVLGTPVFLGNLTLSRLTLTDANVVTGTALFPGGFSTLTSIQGAVYAVPLLLGALPTQIIAIPTADFIGEQDEGRRPVMPWQVVLKDVQHLFELTENSGATYKVGVLQPFLISDQFSNDPDDLLTRAGGLAGYVGILIDTPSGPALRFRPPYSGETVVLMTDCSVCRWNVEAQTWDVHNTLPQRALTGAEAFETLDAQGIYDYYAKILGLMLAQLQYDTKRVQDLVDPASCPDSFLSLLLYTFGADDFEFEESPEFKRELLRTFIGIMQQKGTPAAIENGLKALGLSGYGTHVWAKPTGDPLDVIEKPFSYDQVEPTNPATEYYPTSQVNIHLAERDGEPLLAIDDATKERVARFLRRNVLPAHVRIKWFVSDRKAGTDELGLTDTLTVTPI